MFNSACPSLLCRVWPHPAGLKRQVLAPAVLHWQRGAVPVEDLRYPRRKDRAQHHRAGHPQVLQLRDRLSGGPGWLLHQVSTLGYDIYTWRFIAQRRLLTPCLRYLMRCLKIRVSTSSLYSSVRCVKVRTGYYKSQFLNKVSVDQGWILHSLV